MLAVDPDTCLVQSQRNAGTSDWEFPDVTNFLTHSINHDARKEAASIQRRKEINRESARRVRAKKLAETTDLRSENAEQKRAIKTLEDKNAQLRTENLALIKQNASLMQQNMVMSSELHAGIAIGHARDELCSTPPAPLQKSIFAQEELSTPSAPTPPILFDYRSSYETSPLACAALMLVDAPPAPLESDAHYFVGRMAQGFGAAFGTL